MRIIHSSGSEDSSEALLGPAGYQYEANLSSFNVRWLLLLSLTLLNDVLLALPGE